MVETRSFIGPAVIAISACLLIGTFTVPPTRAVPSDTFTVGLNLQVYDIKMLLSSDKNTSKIVPGWVDVNDMLRGETVAVYLSATSYRDLYAIPEPQVLFFDRDGRQYLNLTVVLMEGSPIDADYNLVVSAEGKTYLHSELSMVTLHVSVTYTLSATAELVSFPAEVTPGESATGTLLVTNTGSVYGEYELRAVSDPDSIAENIGFTIEADLTPGFYEDFEFTVDVAKDAPPGSHMIMVDLWAVTQDGNGERLDSFNMEVRVVDDDEGIGGTILVAMTLVTVIALVAIVGAISLRRKA